jgi:YggT family protein
MIVFLIQLVTIVGNLITVLIIVNAVLSFILPPQHPTREAMAGVLHPLYGPLRRIIPPLGMIDITPLVAILLIRLIEMILITLLNSLR